MGKDNDGYMEEEESKAMNIARECCFVSVITDKEKYTDTASEWGRANGNRTKVELR